MALALASVDLPCKSLFAAAVMLVSSTSGRPWLCDFPALLAYPAHPSGPPTSPSLFGPILGAVRGTASIRGVPEQG